MPMTLSDLVASTKDPLMPGVINSILDDEAEGGGNLLRLMPYETVDSLAPVFTKINSEGPSTGVGYRAINSTFPEGTVALFQESVNLGEIGGDIQIDRTLLKVANRSSIKGASPEAVQTDAKAKLINRTANDAMVNGDRSVNPNGWNGIRKLVDSQQVLNITSIDATATNGIAVGPTSTSTTRNQFLRALDRLARMVGAGNKQNVRFLFNEPAMWALDWACRENNYLNQNQDQFGREITTYKGITIMNPGAKNAVETYADAYSDTNAVLPNSRTFGNSSDCCEIFAVRVGDVNNGICIVQLDPLQTEVVTEHMEAGPAKLIRLSWDLGLWRPKKVNIAVLKGIRANT